MSGVIASGSGICLSLLHEGDAATAVCTKAGGAAVGRLANSHHYHRRRRADRQRFPGHHQRPRRPSRVRLLFVGGTGRVPAHHARPGVDTCSMAGEGNPHDPQCQRGHRDKPPKYPGRVRLSIRRTNGSPRLASCIWRRTRIAVRNVLESVAGISAG